MCNTASHLTLTKNLDTNHPLLYTHEDSQQDIAAIKIQSMIRSYFAKKLSEKNKEFLLNYSVFEKAKTYVDESSKLRDCSTVII